MSSLLWSGLRSQCPSFARGLTLALVILLTTAPRASAIFQDNIEKDLRPVVFVTFPEKTDSPVALGVFDTGNNNITISPEANDLIGIMVDTPGNKWANDGIVGVATKINAGGFLGAALNGPEQTNGAGIKAHILDSSSLLGNAEPVTRNDLKPSLTYFEAINATFSIVNLGTAFVSSGGADGTPLVAEVDPTNAQPMPFPFTSRDPNASNPAKPTQKLKEPRLPLDQYASSVSFFAPEDSRVPTIKHNFNPRFLTTVQMTKPTGGAASFTRTTPNVTLGPAGPTEWRVLVGEDNVFNVDAGSYLTDTAAVNNTTDIIGTDALNRFGQYWDFSANPANDPDGPAGDATTAPTILLFGPRKGADVTLAGPGVLFGVDRPSTGLSRTGVNQLAAFGLPPQMIKDDDAEVEPSESPEQAVSFFRTHLSHSNAAYISGVDALGLSGLGFDHINGASMGGDFFALRDIGDIYFSVDEATVGATGSGFGGGVTGQAALGQHAGDVFRSRAGLPLLFPGTNVLAVNQDIMGLGGNVGPLADAAGRGHADNLSLLDLKTQDSYVADFTFGMGGVMSNLDPVIKFPGDTRDPALDVRNAIKPDRKDIYGSTFDTYFTLDSASLSLAPNSAADVLVNLGPGEGPGFRLFAFASHAGLIFSDDIDAIALDRYALAPQEDVVPGLEFLAEPEELIDGRYVPGGGLFGIDSFGGLSADAMLFSLSRGSPTLDIFDPVLGRKLSAADVFVTDFDGTFAMFSSAESLGLYAQSDNIDALDAARLVPEPSTLALLALLLPWAQRRKQRKRTA